jgi:hypothetical protein
MCLVCTLSLRACPTNVLPSSAAQVLDHEGERMVGRAAILAKLHTLTELNTSWGGAAYRVKYVDCQPLGQVCCSFGEAGKGLASILEGCELVAWLTHWTS